MSWFPIKHPEKLAVTFEIDSRKVKEMLESLEISEKINGMTALVALFGKCKTYQEQLMLFSMKTKPILKGCLTDINYLKN